MSDEMKRRRQRMATMDPGDQDAQAVAEATDRRYGGFALERYVGQWVYMESPTLNWRGCVVGVYRDTGIVALLLHPCMRVSEWSNGKDDPDQEIPTETSDEHPAIIPVQNVTIVSLQWAGWAKKARTTER